MELLSTAPIGCLTVLSDPVDARPLPLDADTLLASTLEIDAGWLPAQGRPVVPMGTRLAFRFELPIDHEITWSGAVLDTLETYGSTAIAHLYESGEHAIRASVHDLDGRLVSAFAIFVDVMPALD